MTPKFIVNYECSACGVSGVRLWRTTYSSHIRLLCRHDAEVDQHTSLLEGIDHIGDMVPAVPIDDTFWGYTSVPQEGVDWWYGLYADRDAKQKALAYVNG